MCRALPLAGQRGAEKAQLRPDIVECLTASGPSLHVFALGEGRHGQLSLDRPLFARERGRLQGFPEAVCAASVSDAVAKRMFGNAMTISVLGSVLGRELQGLLRSLDGPSLGSVLRLPQLLAASSETARSSSSDAPRAQSEASHADSANHAVPPLPSSQDTCTVARGFIMRIGV